MLWSAPSHLGLAWTQALCPGPPVLLSPGTLGRSKPHLRFLSQRDQMWPFYIPLLLTESPSPKPITLFYFWCVLYF